jgi:hypothetical protein
VDGDEALDAIKNQKWKTAKNAIEKLIDNCWFFKAEKKRVAIDAKRRAYLKSQGLDDFQALERDLPPKISEASKREAELMLELDRLYSIAKNAAIENESRRPKNAPSNSGGGDSGSSNSGGQSAK